MTAKEFLLIQAHNYKLTVVEGFYDLDLHPEPGAGDLLEFCTLMDKLGYVCAFKKNQVINVRAPHVKKHEWDNARGWSCTHDISWPTCELVRNRVS